MFGQSWSNGTDGANSTKLGQTEGLGNIFLSDSVKSDWILVGYRTLCQAKMAEKKTG
jgi:hypothetical protein